MISAKLTTPKTLFADIEKQVRFATMKAINNTAFAARGAVREEIAKTIDRPTRRTLALAVVKQKATRDQLSAIIDLDYKIHPEGYLSPQIFGGKRVTKAFERRLEQAGILPHGHYAIFAKRSGYLDQHGNMPGPKIRQILSYFQAFRLHGDTGNMSKRAQMNLQFGKRKTMKWGIAYFVGDKKSGVAPGIWERNYPNGQTGKSFIKPILLFVPGVSYSARLKYFETVRASVIGKFQREFDDQLANAMKTAR